MKFSIFQNASEYMVEIIPYQEAWPQDFQNLAVR